MATPKAALVIALTKKAMEKKKGSDGDGEEMAKEFLEAIEKKDAKEVFSSLKNMIDVASNG